MDTLKKDLNYVWHPFTQMQTAPPPIPIVRAKGAYLFGEDGTQYLDGISSWWVNLHGHAHPYIAERIKKQVDILEHVIFAGFTHAPAAELASRLTTLLPGEIDKIFYSDNGSTSVEIALKMALQSSKKTKIVCLNGAYHGDTFGAMSAAGKNAFNKPFWKHLFDVESIEPPMHNQEERSLVQLEAALTDGNAACFIFEPLILGAGGMVIYSAAGLNSLLKMCHKHDVITIADEVMTGFGRTGSLFACHQIEEHPDIICLSKGITGGFLPLGVTATSQRIYNAFLSEDSTKAFLHGHSYTGNPIACSSALASLELLLDTSCKIQREMIAASHAHFCAKWKQHPKLKRCESIGTILVLEYHSNHASYFASERDQLYHFFLEKGILLRPLGNVVYVLPPYCIEEHELNFIYQTIVRTL